MISIIYPQWHKRQAGGSTPWTHHNSPPTSTNTCHLRKADRSSGTEFRTFPFTYRDADDPPNPPSSISGAETRGPCRGRRRLVAALTAAGAVPLSRRAAPTTRPPTRRQVRRRQARFGRRRTPHQAKAKGDEDRHRDGRHRARRRPSRSPRSWTPSRAPRSARRTTSSATYAPPCRPPRRRPPSRRPPSSPPCTASTSSRRSSSTTRRPTRRHRLRAAGEAATGAYPAPGQEHPGEEPVQPVLRDRRGRLREAEPEGRRPRRDHRHPGLRRRPRPPGAPEDHHRRAQDRRLGHRDRPGHGQRRHLARDDHHGQPARRSPSRGRTWTAPAGAYQFSRFSEAATAGGDVGGRRQPRRRHHRRLRRALRRRPPAPSGWTLNNDRDFTDDAAMKPYKDGYQVGHFGTDNPATAVVERIPFVVEIRKDVDLTPAGAGRRDGRLRQHRHHRGRARHARRRHHRRATACSAAR